MLEPPVVSNEQIAAYLYEEFGLNAAEVLFLPLGADQRTAVYCVTADSRAQYFLKLRQGGIEQAAVTVPRFLRDRNITQVLAPLPAHSGELHAQLDGFDAILYPFVHGRNGYELALSDREWVEFGRVLKRIHTTELAPELLACLPHEDFSPVWRELTKRLVLEPVRNETQDSIARDLRAVLQAYKQEILLLVERAGELARKLQARPPEFVLCHSDLHAGNLLITDADAFYIVDWDNPILAPKERDLMFIGGGLFAGWRTAEQEHALFYRGYGETELNRATLAYYRHERIIQDIAAECKLVLMTTAGEMDRARELEFLKSNFMPGGTLSLAIESYRAD